MIGVCDDQQLDDNTVLLISEVGGRTLYRLLARDAGGETEGVLLNETVPAWVVDIVVEKKLPKFIKVCRKSLLSVLYSMWFFSGHVFRSATSYLGL